MTAREKRRVSVERSIDAPADKIFSVLTDPSRHCEIDGSGTLTRLTTSSATLTLGSTFSMRMRIGIPYTVKNRVLEFEQDRLIMWAHWQGQRWSYRLEPQPDGTTLVRETFDWSTALHSKFLDLVGAGRKSVPNMEKTLERLAALVEDPSDDG